MEKETQEPQEQPENNPAAIGAQDKVLGYCSACGGACRYPNGNGPAHR